MKDQSYYLSMVPEVRLRNVFFPVGHLRKEQVKNIAREAKLATADKPESMGICFVGEKRKFSDFLGQYINDCPGKIQTVDGHVIGTHRGLFAYTIGQCSRAHQPPDRWFVYKKDTAENALIVVPGSSHPLLFSCSLIAKDWSWSWTNPPEGIENGVALVGQVRYRQHPVKCKVTSRSNGRYLVEFAEPQRAVAPGQYVAVWDGDWCLGGGEIEAAID